MKKQPSTLAIGLFVIGAMIIVLAATLFISGSNFGKNLSRAILVFDGNVRGLNIGAPVAFKGVQIGQVTQIGAIIDTNTYQVLMPVEIEFSGDRVRKIGEKQDEDTLEQLIGNGMRGQLQKQSLLTGLLYIQLDLHPGTAVTYYEVDSDLPQLPTIPTDMEQLTRSLDDLDFKTLYDNLAHIIEETDKFVSDPELSAISGNVNNMLNQVSELSAQLSGEVALASPGINQLISNGNKVAVEAARELPLLSQSTQQTLDELRSAIRSFDKTMDELGYLVSDDSSTVHEIQKAARELTAAGRSIQSLADHLEQEPESLIRGKKRQE
jgi:paraquat-inducible protein B